MTYPTSLLKASWRDMTDRQGPAPTTARARWPSWGLSAITAALADARAPRRDKDAAVGGSRRKLTERDRLLAAAQARILALEAAEGLG